MLLWFFSMGTSDHTASSRLSQPCAQNPCCLIPTFGSFQSWSPLIAFFLSTGHISLFLYVSSNSRLHFEYYEFQIFQFQIFQFHCGGSGFCYIPLKNIEFLF